MHFLTIALIALGILFLIQAIYYAGLYSKIYRHCKTSPTANSSIGTPPLSVIIVAKDSTEHLKKHLPSILEQDYPEFEVIVIYDRSAEDCDDVLKLLEDKYPHLYHTFIPNTARYISHKKLGITMGIKASRYDWLVFTEADCYPQSDQWLKQIARNFAPNTDIVLGYSNYEKVTGWFNRLITFDTLLNAMRYLGMALCGHPYMGTGRNLAYRKSLYYKQRGFASHLNLQRGEDDLFINETATGHNTRIETSPESLMCISNPERKQVWREEKIGYMATSCFFHGAARYLMGLETCTRLLFYAVTVFVLVSGMLHRQWAVLVIALLIWILRYVIQLAVFKQTSKKLKTRKFYTLLPLFDLLQPMWNFRFKLQKSLRRQEEFMRK